MSRTLSSRERGTRAAANSTFPSRLNRAGLTQHGSAQIALFPTTRYQGSKRRFLPELAGIFGELEFESALDAFGGTGCVAYLLKSMGKRVQYNDALAANVEMARALIANDNAILSGERIADLLGHPAPAGATFIRDTFDGVYFTREENAWLDGIVARIAAMREHDQRAIAWYALFQSAIAKRPYNLFHRRNLYMRIADVPRSFGNKRTWDAPFPGHFAEFAARANAAIFAGKFPACISGCDVRDVPGAFDLVYLDPPYVSSRGVGVDYAHFYHFLEGLLDYANWSGRIDWKSKHLRMAADDSPWTDPRRVQAAFAALFERYADSTLVVSYRSDGIPTIGELTAMLQRIKRRVEVRKLTHRAYALSTNRTAQETIVVAQ